MEEYSAEGLRGRVPKWVRAGYRALRTHWLSLNLKPRGQFSLLEEEREASSGMSLVIAVHDSPEVTGRCLKSVERFGGQSEVIIVDDGSKLTSTRRLLDMTCSNLGWRLLRHTEALGHSRASSVGVEVSTRPYVCLLNSDTIVTSRSWSGIARAFESAQEIAVVGPSTSQTVTAQVVERAMYCRHCWSDEQIWSFAQKYTLKHRRAPLVDLRRVGGFAFFVRRAVWDQVGGFDKNLHDYGNETEFCQRVLLLGFRVVWTKSSYVHHLGSESYGRTLGLAEIHKRGREGDLYCKAKLNVRQA